jgi:NAD(P)-dependent dehydrogenase (short-subunit alcohol dehydrogenase family)
MKQVIAITGASTRLGALGAQELAKAGHIVYAAGTTDPGARARRRKP